MSRSPTDASGPPGERLDYAKAWLAIFELVDQGQSWSGHERNCCFLNTGQQRFADISAASGLDFADDGRGVALTDWDYDGRLDIWVTNRTGPRVRLLHNETRNNHHFLALRLQGTTCNRDAIGARVEVVTSNLSEDNPQSEIHNRRLMKSLHAGDGFVSQSTKWIHFGLGEQWQVVELIVNWPDGKRESFGSPQGDRFYRLVQGTGRAEAWTQPRRPSDLIAGPVKLPAASQSTRTWIGGRLPFAPTDYETWDGTRHWLNELVGRPLLVNLWSASCSACLAELEEWSAENERLEAAGLRILALSVDGLDDASADATTRARDLVNRLEVPFPTGKASNDLVLAIEIFQRTYIERQRPMPVPCSILIDAAGRLASIYKGRVSVEQLVSDVQLLDATAKAQQAAMVPFSGIWSTKRFDASPRQLLGKYIFARQRDQAIAYIDHYLNHPNAHRPPELVADLVELRGTTLWDQGDYAVAAADFAKLQTLQPGNARLHLKLGQRLLSKELVREALVHLNLAAEHLPRDVNLLMNIALRETQLRRYDQAIARFRQLLKLQPANATAHLRLGGVLFASGDASAAVRHFREAHRLQSNSKSANNLAWILATHSDANIRDGAEAVQLAEPACQDDGFQDPEKLDTLAASYAEAGRFGDAVRTVRQAISLAENRDMAELASQMRGRLRLYESDRPYRE